MRASSPRSRRSPPPAVAPLAAVDRGRHDGATPAYGMLSVPDLERLIAAACALLQDSGCAFEAATEATALFAAAGCAVSPDGRVRIPQALVRETLAGVPRAARLWNRAGTEAIDLDAGHTWFIPGMTAIKVYDLDSGERRDSTIADLERIVRVADSLPNIDAVCVACKDVPNSDIHGEINEFATLIRNTGKPLEYLCEYAHSFSAAIEMASAVRGSAAALAAKPYFLQIVTPLPLGFWATHSDQIIAGARAGIPMSIGTLPIGGASAPITMAGCMVTSLATDFAAMVLGQLACPGAYVIGSSDVRFIEPATGGLGNLPHTTLADIAMHQLRRHLGLPSFSGVSGRAVARRFNEDAVWEISTSLTQAFFSRPATLDYLGLIDDGISFSLHALCLCDEIAGLLRSMWKGMVIDHDTLALDLLNEVGPLGNYLAQRHTANHCRDGRWAARYFATHIPVSVGLQPDRDLHERIDADLRARVAGHRPVPLSGELDAALAAIQRRCRAAWAADGSTLPA